MWRGTVKPSVPTCRRTDLSVASPASKDARPARAKRRGQSDEVKLLGLGYRQELQRNFTLFNNFAASFATLSSFTALTGTFGPIGMTYGGPVVMLWGWWPVTVATLFVGLSLAELASAYPTSGALYYWCFMTAPKKCRVLVSWLNCWIMVLGQTAFTAGNVYTLVALVAMIVEVWTGVVVNGSQKAAILLGVLLVAGGLNCGSIRLTAFITTMGALWHLLGLTTFCFTLLYVAPERAKFKDLIFSWQPNYDVTGLPNGVYTTAIGLLMPQWTIIGYDGSAHFSEETLHAEYNVPRGIVGTILIGSLTAYGYMLSLLYALPNPSRIFDPATQTHGANAVLQIAIDAFQGAYGEGRGGVMLMLMPLIGVFFCCFSSISCNARFLYAIARDGAIPMAPLIRRVDARTQAPVAAVATMVLLTTLLSVPMCYNDTTFLAITSIAVVAMYLGYAMPIACRVSTGRRYFVPGPMNMGPRLSWWVNRLALAWVALIVVLFSLPQFLPVTVQGMNWSLVGVPAIILLSLAWYYFPKHGGKVWFTGPQASLGRFDDRGVPTTDLPSQHSTAHNTLPWDMGR